MKKQIKSFSKVMYILTAVILCVISISYAAVTWNYNPVSSGETLTADTLNELYGNTKYLTDVFEVDSGNVGIGTTGPSGLLHVSAGTAGDAVFILEADTDNNDENDQPSIVLKQDNGIVQGFFGFEAGENILRIKNTYTGDMIFETADADVMTLKNGGNVGIGTTSPSETLEVDGNIKVDNSNTIILERGTGTNRDISFRTTSVWDNVGVLEAYPPTGTNVKAEISVIPRGTGYSAENKAGIAVYNTDYVADSTNWEHVTLMAGGTKYILAATQAGTGSLYPLHIGVINERDTEQIILQTDGDVIFNEGNVGIGTTEPAGLLDLKLNVGDDHIFFDSPGADKARIVFTEGGVVENTNTMFSILYDGAGLTAGDNSLQIYDEVNNVARVHFTRDGKVGIGTTAPQKILHIQTSAVSGATYGEHTNLVVEENDHAHIQISTPANKVGGVIFTDGTASSPPGYVRYDHAADDMELHTAGAVRVTIDNTGNVGIGTTSPDHDLEIGTGTYSEIDAGEAQFTTGSSRTYKENIKPIEVEGILNRISEIPVNTFDFKEEYCNNSDDIHDKCKNKIGLIAEDFHEIFNRGSDKEINGQEVQMALWLAVQELKSENNALKQLICPDHPDADICL